MTHRNGSHFRKLRALLGGTLLALVADASAGAAPVQGVQQIDAAPAKGFHFPYLLHVPAGARSLPGRVLLVEPNNTGRVSDDFDVHLRAARDLAERAIGGYLAKELQLPLLVPVFPRPETGWERYTHQLDRDTIVVPEDPLRRLDLQLLAMIDDARARLAGDGVAVPREVFLTGFSASGTFVNRFTAIHPERVLAAATGGLNGILILPLEQLAGTALPYPLGVADFAEVTGHGFDAARWKAVPQFIYMGALDDNDAVQFDDGYTSAEKAIVDAVIGARMQPDRWERCQELYREAGATATFRTYSGVGHFTDEKVNGEIADFFRRRLAAPAP
jgi:dienelactone hydrolase